MNTSRFQALRSTGRTLAAAALVLAAMTGAASAQSAALPDDDALNPPTTQNQNGQNWAAEAQLRKAAEAGDVVAMERLALMHWYGEVMRPDQAWSRETARQWLDRAAARGSVLAMQMRDSSVRMAKAGATR